VPPWSRLLGTGPVSECFCLTRASAGSVLGEQQHYLEDMQPSMWRLHDAGRDKAHAALLKAAGRAAAGQ